ncbi:alpha/beta fold hydrolase [Flavitalea sp.]|nr:alpha/beta hydrolase [Flavitalea sp.]
MLKTFLFIFCLGTIELCAQTVKPDLKTAGLWQSFNRESSIAADGAVELNAKPGDGMLLLKDSKFSDGVLELQIKGENKQGASFVGLAFHVQDDKHYEAIYFRPFNFRNKERETHSVQYVSMPDHPWEKLRSESPGKYENKIDPSPDPDGWLNVKIVISGKSVKVFVNNSARASLEVESIGQLKPGGVALWVGNNSKGSFRNLSVSPGAATANKSSNSASLAVQVPYGNNPSAGKYFNVGDAKLYYEIYGKGDPFVLLHGGVFGYIDEFSQFIAELSTKYQVICLATRGHGKSEIGNSPFTYQQRAEDAYKVIRNITSDSVIVLGFSDGGYSAFKLAATYPELIKKLIVIGAGDIAKGSRSNKFDYNAENLLKQYGDLFRGRMAIMPEPQRWPETLNKLNALYNNEYMSEETLSKIKCPALVMAGDRDDYVQVTQVLKAKELIPHSQLSIIPGCSHVVFFCNYIAVKESIKPFLQVN